MILRESRRVVRMDRGVIISETYHGYICANAGIDASNIPGSNSICLLPVDPDASARRIRDSHPRTPGRGRRRSRLRHLRPPLA